MTSPFEQLTSWLNSAYAMEQNMAQVLENHARAADDFPELQARLNEHAAESRLHSSRVEECLGLLGETHSTAKSLLGNLTGMVQGASTAIFPDEVVKNTLTDFASEHFEIACYQSLIAAAEETGQTQIAEICREILNDEEAMAGWLEHHIPEVTRAYLNRQATRA